MKRYSLTRRLVATVLLVELLSAVAVTGLAWAYERHAHFRAFDVLLRGHADSILGAVQDAEDPGDNVFLDRTVLNQGDLSLPRDDVYEVRDEKGRILGRSTNWSGATDAQMAEPEDHPVKLMIGHRHYHGLLLHGTRRVDPNDKGGGGTLHHLTVIYASPVDHVWHAVAGAVQFYAIASVALMAVTGLLMAWLLRRGLSPLRDLADEASKVTATAWSFHPSEQARAMAELAPLALAMEQTLTRLEDAFAQQRRFTSDAAHELKTAVAVIKSSLQLLSMRPRDVEEYRAGLERCQLDCSRLEEIVLRMLLLARYEAGASSSDTGVAECNLRSVIFSVRDEFMPVALARGQRLEAKAEEDSFVPLVHADATMLLANLVMNALQHSPSHAVTRVTVCEDSAGTLLTVSDEGEGMSAEVLAHVFERFYRGDPSRDRHTGGTGLGLSICKAIAESAGGRIEIRSETGKGTAVEVWLPKIHKELEVSSAGLQDRLP
ncbi:sensor histidine kinase [Silvibacterium dinghuense]|uniref:histidine kinase n=1 Tax=Silvibacterium dinghuense TaxID=1560006 RepID=A0A4Q1SDB8_9BACT|nr:ATP-binding protein [Silvibacterium dinghuense]RXS95041.1 sensor histidine kinase [Silvibacterium dinghuense]GGH10073.1 hypothetical protein GCM10011586_28250 [Silvibacterium dinghuense]